MSLRLRIILLITALMGLFALALGRMIIDDTRSSIREEIEAGTKVTVQMLSAVVFASQISGAPKQFLLSFLDRLGRVRANHLRLRDTVTGAIVYESPPSIYKAGRDAPEWYARLVVPKTSTINIDLPGARIEIVPDPSRATLDAWDDLKQLLMLGGAFFVAAIVLVFWFVSRSMKPMQQIQHGLAEMEGGRLGVRLPEFRLPEFRRISIAFNRMTKALGDAVAENRRLALAVRQSSDAIVIHEPDGRISYGNPAARRMFRYSNDEIVGKPLAALAAPAQRAEVEAHLASTSRREAIDNVLTRRLTKNGEEIAVAIAVTPLIDPETDAVVGGIVSHRDIAAQLRAQAAETELAHNRELVDRVRDKVDDERRGIARELHDELGQCVTAIRTIAESIVRRADAAEVRDAALSIKDIAARIYDGMHAIVRRLRPVELHNLGLADTLRISVGAWAARNPSIDLNLDLAGDLSGLGEAVDTAVYRLVQEALTNVARHADASRVSVRVARVNDHSLTLSVDDNGHGQVSMESSAAGFGLLGMRERVDALGGALSVEGEPGVGTRLRASIPLPAAQ
jgi:PAS domain S-box-containing protein